MGTICAVIVVLIAAALISPAQNRGVLEYYARGSSSVLGNGLQGTAEQRINEKEKTADPKTTEQVAAPHPARVEPLSIFQNEEKFSVGKPLGNQRGPVVAGPQSRAKSSNESVGRSSLDGTGHKTPRETSAPPRNHSFEVRPPSKSEGWPPGNDLDEDGVAKWKSHPHHRLAPGGDREDSWRVEGGLAARSPSTLRGRRQFVKRRGRRSTGRTHPPSPCPGVFTYQREGPRDGKWYGLANISTKEKLVGVRVGIQLDKPAQLLGAWLGEVQTKDKKDFTIWSRDKIIMPNSPFPVKILVQYDERELQPPRLKTITVNGIQICPKKEDKPDQSPHHHLPQQVQVKRANTPAPPSLDIDEEPAEDEMVDGVPCGQIGFRPNLLINHGQSTEKGDWPWHAALYKSTGENLAYICGGSVIGKRIILTAAHCVSERDGRKDTAVAPVSIVVFLGKFRLKGFEDGTQTKEVKDIHVHPEYNSDGQIADIAILILSTPVQFSEYVKPVCLWDASRPHLSEIEGHEGVVIGWGKNEKGALSQDLMQASMPVVSQQVCVWSNPEFFSYFTSDRTFCAGYRNGTSACNGDSGGGMFFPKRLHGKADELIFPLTWSIRGIVSLSVPLGTQKICDPKHYAVFVDVAKFYHWIKQYH